jgi:Asp-tRNA(Asn)/Glu-tRNA(Gln) amidotransferase A subunit family amidase
LEAAHALARRVISSKELIEYCPARIHKYDKGLNTFITLTEESVLQQAAACDVRRGGGPLLGIPIALKDNIDTRGVHCRASSLSKTAAISSLVAAAARRSQERSAVGDVETLKRLRECRRDIRRVFEDVDVLLPTMREPAPSLWGVIHELRETPPSNVSAFNRFGTPAVSVPCGFSPEGLPVGLQVVGRPFDEAGVLSVAYTY